MPMTIAPTMPATASRSAIGACPSRPLRATLETPDPGRPELAARGRRVWVVPTHEAENYSGTPKEQLEHLRHFERVKVRTSLPKMKFGCIIDAAIGTNLEGPPRGRTLDVITVLNHAQEGCTVISLDTPTGLVVDDGTTPGDVVNATMTLSVALPKVGVKPGGHVGRLFVGDLSLPADLFEALRLPPVDLPAYVTEVVGG